MLFKNKVSVRWKEYFDNTCKGEDLWGHYKTSNGDLYVVIDGASSHEGTKTGGDVAQLIDKRLKEDAINIVRSKHLRELLHSINDESVKVNKGAYAAVAGILHRGRGMFAFGAGDVSILAKKPNGKLLQTLPLDLSMQRDEAEQTAMTEIGTIIDGKEITSENYFKRVNQFLNHGLSNAVGIGESFFLNEKSFYVKDGAALLIASDGITDPFMDPQKESGKIPKENALKLYELINSTNNAEEASEALKDLFWDTQVKEKKKIKADDRTGIFIYMNVAVAADDNEKTQILNRE
ncbi:MAG: serine/threonine protein phosphatase PrpC [Gammaproteobacteria bacterium]|jgi:serine/threonine protein phosphatase PrpC